MSKPATIAGETISLSLPIGRKVEVGGFVFERIGNHGFRLTKPVGVPSHVSRIDQPKQTSPAEKPAYVG